MKKLIVALVFALMILAEQVLACSVSVNDLSQKNLLAAFGASHLDVSLGTVTQTVIADYSRSFIGADAYDCPLQLKTKAKVSFKYSPGKFQNCDASVVVTRKVHIGAELPDGPMEILSYSKATAACSTSLPLPIPCLPGRRC